MKYQVRLQKEAEKELNNLSRQDKERVYRSFLALSFYPYFGTPLGDELKGYYSVNVWPHRIIYKIYENIKLVNVIKVGYGLQKNKH